MILDRTNGLSFRAGGFVSIDVCGVFVAINDHHVVAVKVHDAVVHGVHYVVIHGVSDLSVLTSFLQRV